MFIAYLFALFAIIGDLFGDRKFSGWRKAVWIVCLLLVPFVSALVYVIARGNGMAERRAAGVVESRKAPESYIQSVARVSPSDEIAKAKNLLDSGVKSREEYEMIKLKAMA